MGRFSSSVAGTFVGKSHLVDPTLDSAADGRSHDPVGTGCGWLCGRPAEARAVLEELYRLYCYSGLRLHRRRGRQDAQDLTQDFFVHLLKKVLWPGLTRSGAGSAASCSARWTISWPIAVVIGCSNSPTRITPPLRVVRDRSVPVYLSTIALCQ
jgi:hypothetical protein